MSARARSTTGLPLKAPSGTVAPFWFVHFGCEGSARRRRGRVHRHVLHVVSARWPGDESQERGCGRGEEQAMSLGAPRAQRKPRLSAV